MWLPTYHSRNVSNLNKLGDATKKLAFIWYSWIVENKIDILIYETIRTVEQQKKNVAKGASQTMKSYHIVGQALDFVPIINGKEGWSSYKTRPFLTAIEKAVQLGFESGLYWKGFVDSPHLQYNYKGYGTDTFKTGNMDIGQISPSPTPTTSSKSYLEKGDSGDAVEELQTLLNKLGYNVGTVDGEFGDKTDAQVRKFQSDNGLSVDGIAGNATMNKLKSLTSSPTPSGGIIGTVRVITDGLNIRSGAGTQYVSLGKAPKDKLYNVIANVNDWHRVILADNDDREAWIFGNNGQYLELVR